MSHPGNNTLVFFLNGKKVVEKSPDPECTLLQYLRRTLLMPGTKEGCGNGGCGSCTVMLSRYDHVRQADIHYTVNACLFPLCAAHGVAVTTVEGVGNPRTGLHDVQRRLIESHGVQCGFCTPGFVMSVFCLLRNNHNPSRDDLETALEGNLCRCTGYRPILDAYKSLTSDGCQMGDACCKRTGASSGTEEAVSDDGDRATQVAIFPPELKLSNKYSIDKVTFKGDKYSWIRPTELPDLLALKTEFPQAHLIMGNTTTAWQMKKGMFDNSPVLLYGGEIAALKEVKVTSDSLILGAALTLTEVREVLQSQREAIRESQRGHFTALLEMIRRYGVDQIRNIATIGGSVMSGQSNSDVITLLTAIDSTLTVQSVAGERTIQIGEKLDDVEVVTSIHIPMSQKRERLMFFKQSDRQTFSLANVNAGMYVHLDDEFRVTTLRLCFGGIAASVFQPTQATGKALGRVWDDGLLHDMVTGISDELTAGNQAPSDYKRALVSAAVFKFYLTVLNSDPTLRTSPSSVSDYTEKTSLTSLTEMKPCEGIQLYDPCTEENQPDSDSVGKPIMNVASPAIVSGEALFVDDLPEYKGELFLELVTSTRAHARILKVDTCNALALPGVTAYIDHNDIPGENLYGFTICDEEVFATKEVGCYGQVIGAVVADSREVARKAARLVEIEYEDMEAVLTLQESIDKENFFSQTYHLQDGDMDKSMAESDLVLEGKAYTGPQEHFYMETQSVLAVPQPDGEELDVQVAGQDLDDTQKWISKFLNKPNHKIVCRAKRLGGGFGGKQTRDLPIVGPVVVAANKFQRPVRGILTRETDMLISGKRHPVLAKYKVGVTKEGKLKALQITFYVHAGHVLDHGHQILLYCIMCVDGGAKIESVDMDGRVCRTNTPTNTSYRAYGSVMSNVIMEDIVFNVACGLGIPQDRVREINLYKEGELTPYRMPLINCTLGELWQECKLRSDYEQRVKEVDLYNRNSRYKKRGLAMTTVKLGVGYYRVFFYQATALVHIYKDGTVRLSHGGIECGQGLTTKLVQIASRVLGIPMEKIFAGEAGTQLTANQPVTAASMGTDLFAPAVMDACTILKERLKPVRDANPQDSWEDLIIKAYFERVKLTATGFSRHPKDVDFDLEKKTGQPWNYFTYGTACSEVEIDVLTGEHQVVRTDIMMDVGRSLNPAIDIGQIEGGFIQGLGMMTTEEMEVDPKTGRLTNCDAVSYKIPNVRSIPRQFNVYLLKNHNIVNITYSSKGIGEPPLLGSISVLMAIKEAVKAARSQIGIHGYFRLDTPATVAKIQQACGNQLQKDSVSASA